MFFSSITTTLGLRAFPLYFLSPVFKKKTMTLDEDEEPFVQKILAGNQDSFRKFIEHFESEVFRIVSRHVPHAELYEVSHDVFIRAYKALPRFRFQSPLLHWVRSISLKTCYDYHRKAARNRERPMSSLSSEEIGLVLKALSEGPPNQTEERNDSEQLLELVLSLLSAEDRMVVTLVHLEGLSVKEVAGLLGWSAANVKVRAFRARKKLSQLLKKAERV